MYEEYFGFVEKPFSLTPDPKYLFKSHSHSNAFDLLQYAIRRREGFVVITGDTGTGKTTLCRAILEQTDRKTFSALVLNPFLSEEDLLKLILQDFGVVSRDEVRRGCLARASKQDLIETLYDFLLSLLPLNAGAMLVIDEAQNLPLQVLEQIRILSNLETDKDKLLQIVLVGQPNLQALLRSPEMRQLDQRVSIRYELKPLTRDEAAAYVAHRLAVAGGSAAVAFTPRSLDLIHRLSGGTPRLINLLCDRALLAGFAARTNRIVPEMVTRAAETLDLHERPRGLMARVRRRAARVFAGAAAAAVIAVASAGIGYRQGVMAPAVAGDASQAAGQRQGSRSAAGAPTLPPSPNLLAEPLRAPGLPADWRGDRIATAPVRPVHSAAGSAAAHHPYSILIGSSQDVDRLAGMARELERLGYRPYQVEVDDGDRQGWRQLLVGRYADASQAMDVEARLKRMPGFGEARLVISGPSTHASP